MLISHKKKFIFIHNYKVAGTSVKSALSHYNNTSYNDLDYKNKVHFLFGKYPKIFSAQFQAHATAQEIQEKMQPEIYNSYFKFGFVRNPWDWQVSLYLYALSLENHHQHKLIKGMKNFEEYIEWRVNEDVHLQRNFFYDAQDKCLVDFIGKMEHINSDFEYICNKLNINITLPHVNKSNDENDFLRFYTDKSIKKIAEAFKEDIDLFGYIIPDLRDSGIVSKS